MEYGWDEKSDFRISNKVLLLLLIERRGILLLSFRNDILCIDEEADVPTPTRNVDRPRLNGDDNEEKDSTPDGAVEANPSNVTAVRKLIFLLIDFYIII